MAALPQEIQKLDPELDAIVPAGAKLERVATGFDKWTEGPVWTRDGSLFFEEIPANNIDRWTPAGGTTVFLHPSGYTGAAPYKGPEPGSECNDSRRNGTTDCCGAHGNPETSGDSSRSTRTD